MGGGVSEIEREPNTQYCLSISYGKDSLACLGAIEKLGLPLDRIIHAEVWATDDISADLPPMVEFKKKADQIILDRFGIEVEHYCATNKDGTKRTYEQIFYRVVNDKTLYKREREREREQNRRSARHLRLPRYHWSLVQFKAQNYGT